MEENVKNKLNSHFFSHLSPIAAFSAWISLILASANFPTLSSAGIETKDDEDEEGIEDMIGKGRRRAQILDFVIWRRRDPIQTNSNCFTPRVGLFCLHFANSDQLTEAELLRERSRQKSSANDNNSFKNLTLIDPRRGCNVIETGCN